MLDLFDIVAERPLDERWDHYPKCPYCNTNDVSTIDITSTAIGWYGAESQDPNHRWYKCHCRQCRKKFTKERRKKNIWYTAEDGVEIVKGVPSCFETYIYHCIKCGKSVLRNYKGLDGKDLEGGLGFKTVDGKSVKQFRIYYSCTSCGHGGEVEEEYWRG